MNRKTITIEFFGLPGSGKSTVADSLDSHLKQNNISMIKFSEIFDKYQSNLIRKLYLSFISIIFQPRLFYICFMYKNFNFKSLNQIVYILRLFYFEKTNYFKRSIKNYDFLISDQYLIQAIASLLIPSHNTKIDKKIINKLLKYTTSKIDIFVYNKCNVKISLNRLRKRNNQKTRFDFWDNEKSLINLELMNNIFRYVYDNNLDKTININADDEIEKKVNFIFEQIHG